MGRSGDGVARGGPVGLLAALCGAVDALAAVSAGGLSVAQLQQALPALAGELDRLTGLRDALLAELDGRGGGSVPDRGPADEHSPGSIATVSWWRQAAGCGGPAAGAQLRTAGRLARLPRLAAAVVEDRVGHAQAVVLTRLLDRLGLDELLAAQDQLVVLGASRDPQWLAAWVREQIATYCEPDLDHAAARAAARRYLQLLDEHDGTVSGRFVLPSEQTEALHSVLAALSRRTGLHDEPKRRPAPRRQPAGGVRARRPPRRPARLRRPAHPGQLPAARRLGGSPVASAVHRHPGRHPWP